MNINLMLLLSLAAISVVTLWKGIGALLRVAKSGEIAILPAGGGEVELAEVGELMLSLRGQLGSGDFARARFAMYDATGKEIPAQILLCRGKQTGWSGKTTLTIQCFFIPAAGRYRLETTGIDTGTVAADSRLILSKSNRMALTMGIVWVVLSAVVLVGSIVLSSLVAFAESGATASTPAVGSADRKAILEAIRAALAVPANGQRRFKVHHLRIAGDWAYFEGNEIVHVEGEAWQETDLTVKALLQRQAAKWSVRLLWSLPYDDRLSLTDYVRQLDSLRQSIPIPAGIFP